MRGGFASQATPSCSFWRSERRSRLAMFKVSRSFAWLGFSCDSEQLAKLPSMLLLSDLMQQAWLKIDGVGDLIYSQWEKIFTFPNGFFFLCLIKLHWKNRGTKTQKLWNMFYFVTHQLNCILWKETWWASTVNVSWFKQPWQLCQFPFTIMHFIFHF